MKDYDIKKTVDKNKEVYSKMISFIFSKKSSIDVSTLEKYFVNSIENKNNRMFKKLSDDKYNKDNKSLDDLSIEEINEKSIKD